MRLSRLALAASLLAVPALHAQDAQFGLQAALSLPQNDVKDFTNADTGFGFGVHVAVDLKGGHMVRPRLDLTSVSGSQYGFTGKVNMTFVGLDYMYHVDGRPQGFYILCGGGYQSTKVEMSGYGFSDSDTAGALAIALGMGGQFNRNVGLEARYVMSRPTFSGASDSFKADTLNLGLTVRF